MTQYATVTISASVASFGTFPSGFEYYGIENTSSGYLDDLATALNGLEPLEIEGDSYAELMAAIQDRLLSEVPGHNLLVTGSNTTGEAWDYVGEDVAFVHPLDQDGEDVLVAPNGGGSKQLDCSCTIVLQDGLFAEFDVPLPEATRTKLRDAGSADVVLGFGLGRTEVLELEVLDAAGASSKSGSAKGSATRPVKGHGEVRLASLRSKNALAPHSVRVRAKYSGDAPSSAFAHAVENAASAEREQREAKLRLIEARLRALEGSPRRTDQRRCLRFDALSSPTFIGLFVGQTLAADITPAIQSLVGNTGLDPAVLPALRAIYPALESALRDRTASFWTKRPLQRPTAELLQHVPPVSALLLRSLDLEGASTSTTRRLRDFRVWLSRFANRDLALEITDESDASLNAEPEGAAIALLPEFCALATTTIDDKGTLALDPFWNELYAASLTALEVFFLRYGPRYGPRTPALYDRTQREWARNTPLTRDELEALHETYERAEQESLPQHHARLQHRHAELVWLAFRDARFARPRVVVQAEVAAAGSGAAKSRGTKDEIKPAVSKRKVGKRDEAAKAEGRGARRGGGS